MIEFIFRFFCFHYNFQSTFRRHSLGINDSKYVLTQLSFLLFSYFLMKKERLSSNQCGLENDQLTLEILAILPDKLH